MQVTHMRSSFAITVAILLSTTTAVGQVFLEADRSALPRECGEVQNIFVADLNGDGIPDLAVSNGSTLNAYQQAIATMIGVGSNRWEVGLRDQSSMVIGIADLDGDNDTDILFENKIGINDGTGTFTNVPYQSPTFGYWPAIIEDFTGNGLPDVVALNGLVFLANLGNANLVDETALRMPISGGYLGAAAFDADGDGDLDLFVTGYNGRELLINQNGIFQIAPSNSLPSSSANAYVVAAADIDGDTDMDLVLGGVGQAPRLYVNQGNGTFLDGTGLLGLPSLDVWAIAIGDVDGDGDQDILFGETTGGRMMRNLGGTFAPAPSAFDARSLTTDALTLADMDGDGDLDLLQGCRETYNAQPIPAATSRHGIEPKLLWNDGTGTFRDTTRKDLPSRSDVAFAAIGDLNNDNIPDIVIAQGAGSVMINSGNATFTTVASSFPSSGRPLLADLNGDGLLDCVLLARDGQFWSLINGGGGALVAWQGPYQVTLPPSNFAMDGKLGDINADGLLDLVVATGTGAGPSPNWPPPPSAQEGLWLGGPNGTFTDASSWFSQAHESQGVDIGDMDGDGDLDVVVSNTIYLNQNGALISSVYPAPYSWGHTRVTLADVDGDGDLDIVAGNRCTGFSCGPFGDEPNNTVHLNDGSGAMASLTTLSGTAYTTWCVAVGDTDNDGDVDIVFGNSGIDGYHNRLAKNLGGGLWDLNTGIMNLDFEDTRQVLLADLDRDGDLDLLAVNNGRDAAGSVRTKIYHNLTRQLIAPLPPRLGYDYQLQVHGASAGAGIWLSTQAANTPLPPFGTLGLGPTGLSPFALLGAPTGTVAELTVALPSVPALAGLTVHLQAIDVATLRLSNTLAEQLVNW